MSQRAAQTPNAVSRRTPAAPDSKPPWLYKRVGRYQIQALLGKGTAGCVYRAEDLQLARHVALKAIIINTDSSAASINTIDSALAEARLAAGLEHPNIVHIYEVKQDALVCYIAMELVEGGNLNDLVSSSGPMDVARACQIGAEAAEALAHAHAHGVIHRDVKPANLMLSRTGRCKLTDFGLAVFRRPRSDNAAPNSPAGTAQYVAPEIIQGEEATPRSDIYSLGATLWFLLAGAPPFVADTVPELLVKHLQDPLPKLSKLRPGIPESLARGLSMALAKDPAKRFENADQFAALLRVHTIPIGATGASLGLPITPTPVRRSLLLGGLAAILMTAGLVLGVYWWFTREAAPPNMRISTYGYAYAQPAAAHSPPAITQPTQEPLRDTAAYDGHAVLASDTAALMQLASSTNATHPTENIAVEGTVASVTLSKKAKFFRISFVGDANADVDDNGFSCQFKPELERELQMKFGGIDGPSLSGKRIRVLGRIEVIKDRPTIKIDSPDQIVVVSKRYPATEK